MDKINKEVIKKFKEFDKLIPCEKKTVYLELGESIFIEYSKSLEYLLLELVDTKNKSKIAGFTFEKYFTPGVGWVHFTHNTSLEKNEYKLKV
jgi:hypothetical protein